MNFAPPNPKCWLLQSTLTGEYLVSDTFLLFLPFASFAQRFTRQHAEHLINNCPDHKFRMVYVCHAPGTYSPKPPAALQRFAA